jgi:hypothetical protein
MSKESRYIALLEKLLTYLKNAKLEYFKASDHAVSADKKRYYNQQALQRNRFFQDVLQELYRFGMTSEDLVINRFNFDQLLIASIDTLKASAIEKCVHADQALLEVYKQLREYQADNLEVENQCSLVEKAVIQNKEWMAGLALKAE